MRVETVRTLAYVTVPLAFLAAFWPAPSGGGVGTSGKPVPILPGLHGHLDDAAALTIRTSLATIHLTRKPVAGKPGEGWGLADKSGYPVPPATVRPVLEGLAALRGVEPKTDRPALYGRLGLDVAKDVDAREVSIEDARGRSLGDVILGRQKPDPSGQGHDLIYVRVPSEPRAWLAEPVVTPPADALGWIDHTVVDLPAAKVASVTVTQGADKLVVARPKAGADPVLMDLPKDAKLKTPSAPADLVGALQDVELVDVEPATKLSAPQAVQAKYETFDGLTVNVSLTRQGNASWITLSATGAGKAAKDAEAIDARTKGWAYQVAGTLATQLQAKRADLIDMPTPPARHP